MQARRHQSRDVGHVHEEIGSHLVGNLPESLEVDDPGIGGGAGHDHLGLVFLGQVPDLVVVDAMALGVHAVGNDVIVETREVHGAAVGEVSAVVQVHAQNRVADLAQGLINGKVGRRAAVGLDVDVLRAKEFFRPVPGDVLHHVHALAAAIIPFAGIPLGVLVGQDGGCRCQHRLADEVLRGDELDVPPLAVILGLDGIADLAVLLDQEINYIFDHDVLSFCVLPCRGWGTVCFLLDILYSNFSKKQMTNFHVYAIITPSAQRFC